MARGKRGTRTCGTTCASHIRIGLGIVSVGALLCEVLFVGFRIRAHDDAPSQHVAEEKSAETTGATIAGGVGALRGQGHGQGQGRSQGQDGRLNLGAKGPEPARPQHGNAPAVSIARNSTQNCQVVVDRPGGIDPRYLYERRWIEELSGTCITTIQECLAISCNPRIIISRLHGGKINKLEQRMAGDDKKNKVLLHLSDEARKSKFVPLRREEYMKWAHVFRFYFDASYEDMPNVHWLPLGYASTGHDWSNVSQILQPASKRSIKVSFMGNVGNNYQRSNMLKAFEKKSRTKVHGMVRSAGFGVGERTEYVDAMMNSKFCLAIPGSSLETFRLYEALQAKCIPVMLDEWCKGQAWDNFTKVFGVRPYISTYEELDQNVDELQKTMADRWHNVKEHYKSLLRSWL